MTDTSTETAQTGKGERFINYLKNLADTADRAVLAALRRGLGKMPGAATEAHRHVLQFNPNIWDEWAYYLVAGLFAMHPESWPPKDNNQHPSNFGASFAWLKSKTDSDNIEKRFVALLNCHEDDLAEHLRHAVSLLRSNEILVDWLQLLRDLSNWNQENRRVQRNWSRAFWGRRENDQETGKE